VYRVCIRHTLTEVKGNGFTRRRGETETRRGGDQPPRTPRLRVILKARIPPGGCEDEEIGTGGGDDVRERVAADSADEAVDGLNRGSMNRGSHLLSSGPASRRCASRCI